MSSEEIVFCAFGDSRAKEEAKKTLTAIMAENPKFVVAGGDYSYIDDDMNVWCKLVESVPGLVEKLVQIWLGNHENVEDGTKEAQQQLAQWIKEKKGIDVEANNWCYFNQIGRIAIIGGNSQDMDYQYRDRTQHKWFLETAEKVKQLAINKEIDLVIVGWHKPQYTLKSKHDAELKARDIYDPIIDDISKLVAVIELGFHNHDSQQWKLLQYGGIDKLPIVTMKVLPDGTWDITGSVGKIMCINGLAGRGQTEISEDWTQNEHVAWASWDYYGFMKFIVKQSTNKLDITIQHKSNDGQVMFEQKVTKDSVILGESDVGDTTGGLAAEINNSSGGLAAEINNSSGGLAAEINNSSGGLAAEINNSSGGLAAEINNSSGSLPTADAGSDKEVVPESTVMLNGSKSYDPDPDGGVLSFMWSQIDNGPIVTLISPNNPNPCFIAPALAAGADAIQLAFQLQVSDRKGAIGTDTVNIIVKSDIPPSPSGSLTTDISNSSGSLATDISNSSGSLATDISNTSLPPPPDGEVLWDSNVHLKTSKKFTITDTYGDQKPDGKGVYMAASGSPRLIVEEDGTFHLEADAGHGRVYIKAKNYNARMEGECMFEDNIVRNTTWRLRSRHNEGGSNENKFGGFGATCEIAEQLAEYATEPYHNVHENDIKKPLAKHLEVGKWFKFKYSVQNSPDDKKVLFKTEYDYLDGNGWVTVLEGEHSNPKPYYMDKSLYAKESYAWLRINNEKTGKVAYRNVKLIKV